MHIPKPFIYVAIILTVIALIPPALIARARARTTTQPRIHYVQDMDNQHRIKAQQSSPEFNGIPLFRDARGMRPVIVETVARGELDDDDHYTRGVIAGEWATDFPTQIAVDQVLLDRGEERFNIYCTPCHGMSGYGDGIVHRRAMELLSIPARSNGTSWVPPKSLHEEQIAAQTVGQIYNTITNGVRNMSGYAAQISPDDRWAIVAYVKALQRSQRAESSDVANPRSLPTVEEQAVTEEES